MIEGGLGVAKVAVDAFGGDYAPEAIVEGALLAAHEDGIEVILTGDEEKLKALIDGKPGSERIDKVHAPEQIQMDEAPVEAVRSKKDSSLSVAAGLVRDGRAGACVSAGNTGATLAASLFVIRRIKGVERPAITSLMPTRTGVSLLVDAGANVDCRPSQLGQFAKMGAIYSERVLKVNRPRVGLLNIGHEPGKGNSLVQETYKLLQDSALNFIGNIEGRDVSRGDADVIVCDGFVGNVVLKFAEGLADALFGMLKEELTKNAVRKAGALLLASGFKTIKKRVDYTEYGGAPLLGVDGVVIIAHGGSNAKAICNAIRVAKEGINHGLVDIIAGAMVE